MNYMQVVQMIVVSCGIGRVETTSVLTKLTFTNPEKIINIVSGRTGTTEVGGRTFILTERRACIFCGFS